MARRRRGQREPENYPERCPDQDDTFLELYNSDLKPPLFAGDSRWLLSPSSHDVLSESTDEGQTKRNHSGEDDTLRPCRKIWPPSSTLEIASTAPQASRVLSSADFFCPSLFSPTFLDYVLRGYSQSLKPNLYTTDLIFLQKVLRCSGDIPFFAIALRCATVP